MLPYLKMLVTQRLKALNPINRIRGKHSLTKNIFQVIGVSVGMLALYGMLVAMEYFMFGAFAKLGEPQTMLVLVGVLCTLMVVLSSFFFVLSELFFSKDIAFVSALPITSRGLLTAKLVRIWLGEAGIALLICLPVVVLYGVNQSMGVLYYLKALLLIPLMPMVPMCAITLLSFLLIRISALWKRREVLTIVMSMALLITFIYAEMKFSMSAQDETMNAVVLQLILRQKQVIDLIVGLYPPVQWFRIALVQSGAASLGAGLAFTALNVGAMALVVLLVGKGYQRLAIRQNESFSRINANIKQRVDRHGVRSPLRALYRREIREILLVPVYAMNCLASAVVFPVISIAMIASVGSGNSEMAMLPVFLAMIPKTLIVAIAAVLLAFTASMNMAVSTAVSREGKRHEFFQTLPVKPQTQLLAKLLMGLTVNLICVCPITVMLLVVLPSLQIQIILGFFASLLFSTATCIAALIIDARHPKFEWKNETEAIKQNGMAALSMFGGMAFIAVCGGLCYGLVWLGVSLTGAILILCGLALALDVLLMRHLLNRSSKTYILQELRI